MKASEVGSSQSACIQQVCLFDHKLIDQQSALQAEKIVELMAEVQRLHEIMERLMSENATLRKELYVMRRPESVSPVPKSPSPIDKILLAPAPYRPGEFIWKA